MKNKNFEKNSGDLWDSLCEQSNNAGINHTVSMMEYFEAYKPDNKTMNISFFILDNLGKPVGICPLFLEQATYAGREIKEFSLGGFALPAVAFINSLSVRDRSELTKQVFTRIDELALENKVSRISVQSSPLLKTYSALNPFLRFGYLGHSIPTHILNLNLKSEELRKEIRKGHRADIKRAQNLLEFSVFTHEDITSEIFKLYQDTHFKAAGRMTRPQITFDLMFEMIKKSHSFLVGARKDGKFIGFGLFEFFKSQASYSSAANDPDYHELPISHGIQAVAIDWLQSHGCELYELGWQHFGPQLTDLPSEKEKAISHFKRGFGGETFPLHIGEKYYDRDFCKIILRDRIENYTNTV
jgi:hypothetical protein